MLITSIANIIRGGHIRLFTGGLLNQIAKSHLQGRAGLGTLGSFCGLTCSFTVNQLQRRTLVSFSLYPKDLQDTVKMHSEKTVLDFATFQVIVIPATQDNFMYLIVDKKSQSAFVVDPVEPESVLNVVRKENVVLKAILTTHHHWDHAGGNEALKKSFEEAENGNKLAVYGGDKRIGALTNEVKQGSKIEIDSLKVDCFFTPCHTSGHICYYLNPGDSNEPPAVFTGDTLFIAGCGRFFEGTPDQMHSALIEKLGSLPDETRVFCGHEYTVNNLKFALKVEPNNEKAREKLAWAEAQREKKIPTVPSKISEEKEINPFMRTTLVEMQKIVGANDAISCMGMLRSMKDNFKA